MLRETHQDFVVRSSDFRVKKSAWERPFWIFVLHLRTKKRKSWWLVCKTKNLKVKWKLRRRQEAVSLWMMQVLKIANIQFLIFLSRLAFLSSASMKLKGNKWKRNRKKKDTLGSHTLKEDVKTTRLSITSSI